MTKVMIEKRLVELRGTLTTLAELKQTKDVKEMVTSVESEKDLMETNLLKLIQVEMKTTKKLDDVNSAAEAIGEKLDEVKEEKEEAKEISTLVKVGIGAALIAAIGFGYKYLTQNEDLELEFEEDTRD